MAHQRGEIQVSICAARGNDPDCVSQQHSAALQDKIKANNPSLATPDSEVIERQKNQGNTCN